MPHNPVSRLSKDRWRSSVTEQKDSQLFKYTIQITTNWLLLPTAVEEATLVLGFVMLWWANEADNVTEDLQTVVPS